MTIEIISVSVSQGVVTIQAIDCSDENLQRMQRTRDDGFEKEISFIFDTRRKSDYEYLRKWLHQQKATKGAKTWGDALHSIYGTVTTISGKFLELA